MSTTRTRASSPCAASPLPRFARCVEPRARLVLASTIVATMIVALPGSSEAQDQDRATAKVSVSTAEVKARDVGPIRWMAPESIRRSERAAELWSDGRDDEALRTWTKIVNDEAKAGRLRTAEQAADASQWVTRMAAGDTSGSQGRSTPERLRHKDRVVSIQKASHDAAMAAIRNMR